MATFQNTKLGDELSISFNISGHISSLAYKDELSANEIKNINSQICSVVSTYPTASVSSNGLMSLSDFIKLSGIEEYANNYVLPTASSDSLGGIKIGYTISGKKYPLELDEDEKAYVAVDWVNTTYSAGKGLSLDTENNTFSISDDYVKNSDVSNKLALSSLSDISINFKSASDNYLSSNALDGLSVNWTYEYAKDNLSNDGYVTSSDNERVWIKNDINGNISGCYSDISVIKIPISSYEHGVINNTLCDNILYVIDSDYIDAYGQQICSLTMGDTEETKFEGIAATKTYVDKSLESKGAVLSAYNDGYVKYLKLEDNLSVVKITNELYDTLTIEEKTSNAMMYVINDEYVDIRGQEMRNIPTPLSTQLSNASNVEYVNQSVSPIVSVFHELYPFVMGITEESELGDLLSVTIKLKELLSAF